ncbi:MAG: hypothetical protein Q8807_03010, partial ['Waltheria sp.' little leaf phytoplasma]|nr:hypothetical protein ['Waltheria sp.' little leaf phytoplasma]
HTLSPAMSPSVNSWPQQVPTPQLPGSSLQASRLMSSLNARDIPQFSPQYPDQVNAPNCMLLNQPQQHQIGFSAQDDSALEASLPETISPWNGETISLSNTGIPAYSNLEKQQQMPGSLCSRELGYKISDYLQPNAGSIWEIPNGKVDWSVQGEPGQFIGHYGVEPAFHGLSFC